MNKVVFFGRIHFKNKRSVTFAKEAFIRYNETIAKGDMMLRPEALFGEELELDFDQLSLEFEKNSYEATDKTISHTMQSMEALLQYAVAGQVDAFVIAANDLPEQITLTVNPDKSTAHAYITGVEALEASRYQEAVEALSESIDSYANHPWAYNARGLAYFELGDLDKAQDDFTTSKSMYAGLPSPHLGLAKIFAKRGELSAAMDSCKRAMKCSIPHQPGFWIATLFLREIMLDRLESDLAKMSSAEADLYFRGIGTDIERYDLKLRQLGKARSKYYPTPEYLQKLQSRFEELSTLA